MANHIKLETNRFSQSMSAAVISNISVAQAKATGAASGGINDDGAHRFSDANLAAYTNTLREAYPQRQRFQHG
ncbi:hypothetical protein LTR49_026852 [Elasticomyces elasticus]|nr:hypothetical protein LTR49_026852 [Elasticomyces elasticus]